MPTPSASSIDSQAVNPSSSLRSRRVRALLASGLVLGVGATMTLASWNDSEYAGGSIEAGSFAIEGSTTGQNDFTASSAENPHSLTIALEDATSEGVLYPGSTTYALFSVRAAEGSLGGTVQVLANEANAEGLGAYLTYGVREISGTTCNATSFNAEDSTNVVSRGSALTEGAPSDNVQTLGPNAASSVNYCLELVLPVDANNEAQTLTATPQWEFVGTSLSE